jgi:hypothetical protein
MIDFKDQLVSDGISAVVATCSARKQKLPVSTLLAESLPPGPQTSIGAVWLERLAQVEAKDLFPARDLYGGRSFQRILALSEKGGYRLLVISAGLGLLDASSKVPSYDLTLAPAMRQSVPARVTSQFEPSEWWETVVSGPYSIAMKSLSEGSGRVLISLTHSYADLVGQSLSVLPPATRSRLRIFGSGLRSHLPTSLHAQIVDYDARLDRVQPGTRLDASSRAMAHFVGVAGNTPITDIEADQAAVEAALSGIVAPEVSIRKRVSDEALTQLIVGFISSGMSATTALKQLRGKENIACEQGRFRRLFDEAHS